MSRSAGKLGLRTPALGGVETVREEVNAIAVDAGRVDFLDRDQAIIAIRFRNDSIGSLVYAARGDTRLAKELHEVCAGERAAMLDHLQKVTAYRNGKSNVAWKAAQAKGHREVTAFMRVVRDGGPAPIPYQEIVAVTRATFAAEESLRTGLPGCL